MTIPIVLRRSKGTENATWTIANLLQIFCILVCWELLVACTCRQPMQTRQARRDRAVLPRLLAAAADSEAGKQCVCFRGAARDHFEPVAGVAAYAMLCKTRMEGSCWCLGCNAPAAVEKVRR